MKSGDLLTISIFKEAKGIESDIEKFLKNIELSASHFEPGLKECFEGKDETFADRCSKIQELESQCDSLRFDIKFTLYVVSPTLSQRH